VTVTNKYLPPILPDVAPGGLADAARELPSGYDWSGGVTFTPSCGGADRWGCSYGEDKQNIIDKGEPTEFDPFLIYSGFRCSGAPDEAELRLLAQNALTRGLSRSLAHELVLSDVNVGNPDIVSSATDITPDTPACIAGSVAGLLSASDDCGGGGVWIHAPRVALPFLMKNDLVKFDGEGYRIGGHKLIVDDYPNEAPTGGAEPTDGQAYLYATGPVEYAVAEQFDIANFEHIQNEQIVLLERLAILRFDPCCSFAILTELC
jgi:hypothetical protein